MPQQPARRAKTRAGKFSVAIRAHNERLSGMSIFADAKNTARSQPLGCAVSAVFSVLFIGLAAGAVAFCLYAIAAVPLFKGAIQDSTGFYTNADMVFVNLFTGKCAVRNLRLENPSVYNSAKYFEKSGEHIRPFMTASKVECTLDPMALLAGKVRFSAITANIVELNCVRLNNSTYNVSDFFDGIRKSFSVEEKGGKRLLESIDIRIDKASYRDLSSQTDVIRSDILANVDFSDKNVSNFKKMFSRLSEMLVDKSLGFIAKGIIILEDYAK